VEASAVAEASADSVVVADLAAAVADRAGNGIGNSER